MRTSVACGNVPASTKTTTGGAMHDEGTKVKWKWGSGYGHGTVQSTFTEKTTRKIDGEEVTRDGSQDNPAYYIRVEGGNNVLKLHSELEKD